MVLLFVSVHPVTFTLTVTPETTPVIVNVTFEIIEVDCKFVPVIAFDNVNCVTLFAVSELIVVEPPIVNVYVVLSMVVCDETVAGTVGSIKLYF